MNSDEAGLSPSTNTKNLAGSKETLKKRESTKKPRVASSRAKASKTTDGLAGNQESVEAEEGAKNKSIKKSVSRSKKATNVSIDTTSSNRLSTTIPKSKQPRKASNSKTALNTGIVSQSNVSQATAQSSKQTASTRRALLNSSGAPESNHRRLGLNLPQHLPPTEADYLPSTYLSNIFTIVRRHQEELLTFSQPEAQQLHTYRPASFRTSADENNSSWLSPETLKLHGLEEASSDLKVPYLSHPPSELSLTGLDHVVCAILLTQEKSEEVIGWKKANINKTKQFSDPLRYVNIKQYTSSESCVLVGSDQRSDFEPFTTFNRDMSKYASDMLGSLSAEPLGGWSNARSLYYKGMNRKSAPANISEMSNIFSPTSNMNKNSSLRKTQDSASQSSSNASTSPSATATFPSSTFNAPPSSSSSATGSKITPNIQSSPVSNPRCRQQFLSPYKKSEQPSDALEVLQKKTSPFTTASRPQPKIVAANLASSFSPAKRTIEMSSLVENSQHPNSRRRLDLDLEQASNVSVSKSTPSNVFPVSPFSRKKVLTKPSFSPAPNVTTKSSMVPPQISRGLSDSRIYFNLSTTRSTSALQFLSFLPCCTPLTRSLLSRYLQDFEQALIQYNSGTRFFTEGKLVPSLDLSALAQSLEGLLSRCSASSSRTLSTAQGIPMLRCASLSTNIIMQNMSTVREREDGQVPCIQVFFSRPLTHSRTIKPMVELPAVEAPQLRLQEPFQIPPNADGVNWAEGQIRRIASTVHQPRLCSGGFDCFGIELNTQASPLLPKEAFGLTDTHDELALDLIEAELMSTLERLEARNTPTVFEVDPKVVKELTSKWLSATQQALDDLLVCMQRKGISATSSKTRYHGDGEHHSSNDLRENIGEDGSDSEDEEAESLTLEMTSMLRLIGLDSKTVRWNEEQEAFDLS